MIEPSPPVSDWIVKAWVYLAVAAGSVTGVFQRGGLTLAGKFISFFTGATTSVFMGPVLINHFMPGAASLATTLDKQKAAAVLYALAVVAASVWPEIIKSLSRLFGDPLSLLKAPKP